MNAPRPNRTGRHAAHNELRGLWTLIAGPRPRRGGRRALSRAVNEGWPVGPRPRESGDAKSRAARAEQRDRIRSLYADGWRWDGKGFTLTNAEGCAVGWTNARPEWPGLRRGVLP